MALLCHHLQSQCDRSLCRIRDHIASLLHWPGAKLQTPLVDANVCLWRWGGRVAGLRLCHWRCAALDRASLAGAIGLGLALALSSTALVLPMVGTQSAVGRSAFAMLLFEDLAIVPIIFALGAMAPNAQEAGRSEEHTSELQSLMRISYAVFCLKKKKIQKHHKSPQRKERHKHRRHMR